MAGKKRGASSAAQEHRTVTEARRAKGKVTHENPLLPHKTLREMHACMLSARRFQQRAASLLKQRKAPAYASREASLIGVHPHLLPQDRISAATSDFAPQLLRGAEATALMRELRAKKPRSVEDNGVLPPITPAAQRLAVAAGVALAAQSADNKSITIAWLDPLDLDDDNWLDTVSIAGQLRLPIVFLCLDGDSVRPKARRRHFKHLREATLLKGGTELVPVVPVDGMDVVALYRVAQESVLRARTGIGPTVIWCERWPIGSARRNVLTEFETCLAAKGLLPAKTRLS